MAETERGMGWPILEREPPPMSSLQEMTPSLDRIVKTCLAKDPENRWQSARDLCRELKWAAESEAGERAIQASLLLLIGRPI